MLGQGQAEFFYRSRHARARGLYDPRIVVEHIVPQARLTRNYFRRWWYWKGVSHARLHWLYGETELGLDLHSVPRLFGVPRYLVRSALSDVGGWLAALVRGDGRAQIRHFCELHYIAGYAVEMSRLRRRRVNIQATPWAPRVSPARTGTVQ
jgi:hypothetical protein